MNPHVWQRHPKAAMNVCASCGRHWWHNQPEPTDPCTGRREQVPA